MIKIILLLVCWSAICSLGWYMAPEQGIFCYGGIYDDDLQHASHCFERHELTRHTIVFLGLAIPFLIFADAVILDFVRSRSAGARAWPRRAKASSDAPQGRLPPA